MPKIKKQKEEISTQTPTETPKPLESNVFANPSGIPLSADNVKVELSEEDKERFFKAFLSNSSFEDEVKLMKGTVTVKFKSINVEENNEILSQVGQDVNNGKANNREAYVTTMLIYRFAQSLVSISGFPFDYNITKENFVPDDKHKNYIEARVAKFKDWPTFKLSTFLYNFLQFEKKLMLLEQAINNPDF